MEKLIVGLGNPGTKYSDTRHNIGQIFLDKLGLSWSSKYSADYACQKEQEHRLHYLKPMTFMNLSGKSVAPCASFFKVTPANLIVVHDELDLPFGTIALKKGGGLAGHNGLRSIAEHLGTQDFIRLRLGIGRPTTPIEISDYVLQSFRKDELLVLDSVLLLAHEALKSYIYQGYEKASSIYSKKSAL